MTRAFTPIRQRTSPKLPCALLIGLAWVLCACLISLPAAAATTHTLVLNVTPSTSQPANGINTYNITVLLSDPSGIQSGGHGVTVQSNIGGESVSVTTNSRGEAAVIYGPKTIQGTYTITARLNEDPAVTTSVPVTFTPDQRVILLKASPQFMPWGDRWADNRSTITVTVLTSAGTPVASDTVSFRMLSATNGAGRQTQLISPGKTTSLLNDPILLTTNVSGMATVQFQPGIYGAGTPPTGTAVVEAAVGTATNTITLTYTQQALINIDTSATAQVPALNTTVNVGISLAPFPVNPPLGKKPVDVMLVIDNSGSMWYNSYNGQTRINWVKQAAKTFVGTLDPATDRVGLVVYDSRSRIASGLSSNFNSVNATIDAISNPFNGRPLLEWVPFYGYRGQTNTRDGLYNATSYLKNNARVDALRSEILLTDGVHNNYGNPLAHGIGWPRGIKIGVEGLAPGSWNYYWINGTSLTNDSVAWTGSAHYEDFHYYDNLGGGTRQDWIQTFYGYFPLFNYVSGMALGVNGGWCVYNGGQYANSQLSGVFCTPSGITGYKRLYSYYTYDSARFTNQNMSVYAVNNNIQIFTIATMGPAGTAEYPSEMRDIMLNLANSTGGIYYERPEFDQVATVYRQISSLLYQTSPTTVTLTVDDSPLQVNGGSVASGSTVFDYLYNASASTKVTRTTKIGSTTQVTDNTNNLWSTTQAIPFGSTGLSPGESWSSNYQHRTKLQGLINVFGPDSTIAYSGGASFPLPDTYIYVPAANLQNRGFTPLLTNGTIRVLSTPVTGATIYLNGTATGNITNTWLGYMAPGAYSISVKKTGYQDPASQVVTLSEGESKTVTFNLAVALGNITVGCNVASANIFIDTVQQGRQTVAPPGVVNFGGISPLTTHDVHVEKTSSICVPGNANFTVPGGSHINLSFTCTTNPGTLHVTSTPPGAAILVDGLASYGTTENQISLAGDYQVTVNLDHYIVPAEESVTVNSGEHVDLHFTLVPKPSYLKVMSNPDDADITVDGFGRGQTEVTIPVVAGTHTVEASKNKYVPASVSVDVGIDETREIKFELIKVVILVQ